MTMTERHALMACVLSIVAVLAGCVSVDPGEDRTRVRALIAESTGLREVPSYDDAAPDHAALEQRWADGLTEDEAIAIALANNPELLATIDGLGITRAEWARAATLSNPSLSGALLFPSGGGLVGLQGSIAQELSELWQLSSRRRAAEARLDRAVLAAAEEARRLVLRVEVAFLDAMQAETHASLLRVNDELARDLWELTRSRVEVGRGTELDVSTARAELLTNELEAREAEVQAASKRLDLARLLGVPSLSRVALVAPETHVDDAAKLRTAESLTEDALERRLDLRAAAADLKALRRARADERRARFGVVNVGATVAREPRRTGDSTEINGGPTLDLELPIFHQNQAGVAAAEARLRRAQHELDALRLDARHEIERAHAALNARRDALRAYDEVVIPEHERQLELSRQSYDAGQVGYARVLDAQRALLAQRRLQLDAERAAAESRAELARATGLPMSRLLDTTPDPDSFPSDSSNAGAKR